MATRPVPPGKLRDLITIHYFFQPSLRQLGGLLHLASSTVGEYLRAFNRSSLSLADVQTLGDAVLRERLVPPRPKRQNRRQNELTNLFPAIHHNLSQNGRCLLREWEAYRKRQPRGYGYSQFTNLCAMALGQSAAKTPRHAAGIISLV